MSSKQKFTTYVEDADEDTGSVLEGTQRFAASVAPSPTKEKSNTGKSRREKPMTRRTDSSSPHTHGLTDSDSTVHPSSSTRKEKEVRIRTKEKERQREKEREQRERERERERERQAKKVSMRPPPKHSKTTPVVHTQTFYKRPTATVDDPQFYGVPTITTPAPQARPRAMTARPTSYYGAGSRPPAANAQWYASQTPTAYTPTSYPPQSWAVAGGVSYPVQSSPMQPQQGDYFGSQGYSHAPPQNQHLLQRFSRERPSSAIGFRSSPSAYSFDDYEQENEAPLVRRTSLTRKHVEDRRRMPPPPQRPQSAAPPRQAIRPPPPQPSRRTSAYDDEDFQGGETTYQDVIPRSASYEYKNVMLPTRHRRGSVTYDLPAYSIEPASNTGRRHSYYGSGANSNYEDKYQAAAAYQDGVNGGPPLPLTKDALRKAGKRSGGASSRSTRSSESRDESDYRHSATTQTTRSSAGDEDITIKVTGQAVLKVAGAEIQCQDGGEINIARQGGTRIGGSDKGSTVFDDRRSRSERLPTRIRATSQAGSWSRSQPSHDPYARGTFF